MIPEVQAAVDRITSERERFERVCGALSDAELRRPVPDSTWIVKDFISHLATIDGPIAAWFGAIAGGSSGGPGFRSTDGSEAWNVDRFNDDMVAKRRDQSLDDVFAEAARARANLIAVMGRLTEAQVQSTIHFGGDSKRPPSELQLARYLQGWSRHDAIHLADMLKALPERRSDAQIAAWLDEPEVKAIVGFYQKAMA